MDIEIRVRPKITAANCREIASIYEASGMGSEHDEDKIRAMYGNSSYYVLAEYAGAVVGLLRGFSDGTVVSYLVEVAVARNCRRRGVGSSMVRKFLDEYAHTAIYTFGIKGRGHENFFAASGLKPKDHITGCSRQAMVKNVD